MLVYDSAVRRDAAAYARRFFARTITLDTYLEYFADSGDPLIRALVEALVHEPRRDGLLGLREKWWRTRYWASVERLLEQLEKGSAGELPVERVYPRVGLWSLVIGGLLLMWAGLSAAEHLGRLLNDIQRSGALSFWNALSRSVTVGALALVTAAGLEGWIDRLQLYRTRRISVRGAEPGRELG
jgi:hypothetical protein